MGEQPPPLFDDGGELPETAPKVDREIEPPVRRRPRRPRRPNYRVRRVAAAAAALAVVGGGAYGVSRFVGGDDSRIERLPVEWNTVVLLDDREVRLVEPGDGDAISSLQLGSSVQQLDVAFSGGTLVTLDEDGVLELRDVVTGQLADPIQLAVDDARLRSLPGEAVVAGTPGGGDLTIVDGENREAFAIGEIAGFDEPRILLESVLANPAGTHIAAAETRTFQSALVDVRNRSSEPFAGLIVALDDTTVVTAQRAGTEAELEFYDLTKSRRDSVDVEAPIVVLITGERTAVTVADDGSIHRVDAAKGDAVEVGQLGLDPDAPASTAPTPLDLRFGYAVANGTRALVGTADRVYLVDDTGGVLGQYEGELLEQYDHRLGCAVVGSRTRSEGSVMIDLASGQVLGEMLGGEPASTSVDGCTAIIGSGPTANVYDLGEDVDLDLPSGTPSITPDGSAVVVAGRTSVTLHRLGDDDATTLADGFADVRFLDR